jgi:hypothetical protein
VADVVSFRLHSSFFRLCAFRLAEDRGIVLLNGGGFEAPQWSMRLSLANLPDEVYEDIGRGVRTVAGLSGRVRNLECGA